MTFRVVTLYPHPLFEQQTNPLLDCLARTRSCHSVAAAVCFSSLLATSSSPNADSAEAAPEKAADKDEAQQGSGEAVSGVVTINRAPTLTLWVAAVAERQGYAPEEALTFGKYVSGVFAHSKGELAGLSSLQPVTLRFLDGVGRAGGGSKEWPRRSGQCGRFATWLGLPLPVVVVLGAVLMNRRPR